MKDTKSKNPNAFKPRIGGRAGTIVGASPSSAHNMGCKCKKSECLKKYCEVRIRNRELYAVNENKKSYEHGALYSASKPGLCVEANVNVSIV